VKPSGNGFSLGIIGPFFFDTSASLLGLFEKAVWQGALSGV